MQLTHSDVEKLRNIISTCVVAGIDSIIIDDGTVRGINKDKTCVIISNNQVPKFDKKIGITRLSSLKQRIDIFQKEILIDAIDNNKNEIYSLDIKSGKNKVQFRCTSTQMIKVPVSINDNPLLVVTFEKEECKMILDSIKIMGAKKVLIQNFADLSVAVEASDASNDIFRVVLNNQYQCVNDTEEATSNVYFYAADIFTSILRSRMNESDDNISVVIGERGTLNVDLSNHCVTIMPQIGDNEDE